MSSINETESPASSDGLPIFDVMTIALIIISYLLFVYRIGPRSMQNRPAYKLKTFMSLYNIFQVLTCTYVVKRIFDLTSWSIFDVSRCIHYRPNTLQRKEFDDITYKVFLLKIVELIDTIIFVLRKKQNQITYLHVFHHSATITLCYMSMKYTVVNGALFPIFVNSFVHIIMYSYYFFANICSAETMRKFIPIKKSITIIQMVQFCIILGQAAIMWSYCKLSPIIKYYYFTVVFVIFYGFYDFYKKAYLSKQDKPGKMNSQ